MKNRVIKLLLVAALTMPVFVTMSGCAFGDRHVALKYEPVVEAGASKGQKIAIKKFEDLRQVKDVGEVRNAYGMKTAKVLADNQDVGAWVANAMSEELTRAGFQVEKFSDVIPPEYDIQITGVATEAYTKMYFNATATIRININVNKARMSVLSKEYSGTDAVLVVAVTPGEYENALQGALQDLMKKCVPDIMKAIQ